MNRRDFVKALAGIPLLGLLVKVPEAEAEFKLTMPGDPGYIDVSVSSPWHTMVYEGDRLISDDDSEAFTTYHTEPFTGINITFTGEDPPSIWEYHNGQEWVRIEL